LVIEFARNPDGPRDIVGRPDLDSLPTIAASVLVDRGPLVVGVGDDSSCRRRDHLTARPSDHGRRRRNDGGRDTGSSKTRSPGSRSAIVRHPLGVGMGVSSASALPSNRATRSFGSSTHSSVWPRTNSPGWRMNGSSSANVEHLGQVRLGRPHVDVRVAVVAEDPERAVQVEVDR
jgi:hypothetical protein